MQNNVYIYIAVMAVVTYLIRVLPLTLVRREIKNIYIRSFLYYVPYVTLSVMTFPSMMDATGSKWSGLAALVGNSGDDEEDLEPLPDDVYEGRDLIEGRNDRDDLDQGGYRARARRGRTSPPLPAWRGRRHARPT